MVLYFSNIFPSYIKKDVSFLLLSLSPPLTLKVLTNPLILGNTKTNDLVTLSKYSIKYLELDFAVTNFGITILSTITSQIYFGFLEQWIFSLATFVSPNLNILISAKKFFDYFSVKWNKNFSKKILQY